jgi:glycosyltransferase involved in cell wall biosynthesis
MPITISAVVGAYDGEQYLAETLDAILGQTRPPDEVIVVDDGSTDGTPALLAGYGDRIRVIRQTNGGCPAAFNTAFAAATGDYVAMCGADDVWEPDKLAWQAEAIEAHPEIDMAYGGARNFGLLDSDWPPPPTSGIMDGRALTRRLFVDNTVCASSIVLRRALWERLGRFVEVLEADDDAYWSRLLGPGVIGDRNRFSADDFEYWMRVLAAGGTVHYEPRRTVRYRRHEANATRDRLWIHRSLCFVHRRYADHVGDAALVRAVDAQDLFAAGRILYDRGEIAPARAALAASLRRRPSARRAAWTALLSLPAAPRRGVVGALRAVTRGA